MKKAAAFMLCLFLIAAVMLAMGCGGSDGDEAGLGDSAVVETGSEEVSVVGTFEASDGRSITFKDDGTFTTGDWEGRGGGTYEVVQGQLGKDVDLVFENGSRYTMAVIIVTDEVAAVNDAEGNSFMKK